MTVSIRLLNPEDWEIFSETRLEALKKYPHVFSSEYEKESKNPKEEWQDFWLNPQKGKFTFGLFDGDSIIGITGVFTFRGDPEGKTGILAASYIKPSFQGKGLSHLLYRARIDCAVGYKAWKKLIVSHRDGNEASRRANQKWGFRLVDKTNKTWPDGTSGDEYHYELDLEKLRQAK